jgi:hypothetical protein
VTDRGEDGLNTANHEMAPVVAHFSAWSKRILGRGDPRARGRVGNKCAPSVTLLPDAHA